MKKRFKKAKTLIAFVLCLALFAVPIKAEESEAVRQEFIRFAGVVSEIWDHNDSLYVLVEDAEGSQMRFIVNETTYLVTEEEIVEGAKAIGFYDTNLPMTMIYPPQPIATVFAVNLNDGESVYTGRFDDNLVSYDNTLKLNIGEHTQVLTPEGEIFDGETIANRKLAVVYGASTRSIPAQTTPDRIVVLYETALPLPETDAVDLPIIDVSEMQIYVNGKTIEAPKPFNHDEYFVMLPLRAIAEALGFEVEWINASKEIFLKSDSQEHTIATVDNAAVVIKDGVAYLPMAFYRDELSVNEAYALDGEIHINNDDAIVTME